MKGFYYIEVSVSEFSRSISGYFETLEEAKEAIKYAANWYRPNGTGNIYFQPLDTRVEKYLYTPYGETEPKEFGRLITSPREFICRGLGINENGKVEFSDKEF